MSSLNMLKKNKQQVIISGGGRGRKKNLALRNPIGIPLSCQKASQDQDDGKRQLKTTESPRCMQAAQAALTRFQGGIEYRCSQGSKDDEGIKPSMREGSAVRFVGYTEWHLSSHMTYMRGRRVTTSVWQTALLHLGIIYNRGRWESFI